MPLPLPSCCGAGNFVNVPEIVAGNSVGSYLCRGSCYRFLVTFMTVILEAPETYIDPSVSMPIP